MIANKYKDNELQKNKEIEGIYSEGIKADDKIIREEKKVNDDVNDENCDVYKPKLNLKDIGSINRELNQHQEVHNKDKLLKPEDNKYISNDATGEIDKKLQSSVRSDLTSMLNEITKTNSQINAAIEKTHHDLNIVKNLGKVNNLYNDQDEKKIN